VNAPLRDALATSVLFDVFALNQAVGRFLGAAMAGGPLAPAEYAVYSAIFELEAASPTALAGRLGMALTTFADHLRIVERRDHARRLPNPRDGRSYLVVLTNDGLAAHREANRRFEAAHRAFVAALLGGEAEAKARLAVIRAAAERASEGFGGGLAGDVGPAPTPPAAGARVSPSLI
jgi:DNA-binding MarR family transcriptional regulator